MNVIGLLSNPFTLYLIVVAVYYLSMCGLAFNGWFQELMGHHHAHGRIHYLIWQFHTGQHVHPLRSYGDEKRLKRTASSSNRSTPEGSVVYYAKRSRKTRAGIRNGIVLGAWALLIGLLFNPAASVAALTSISICLIFGFLVFGIRSARGKEATKTVRVAAVRPFATVKKVRGNTEPEAIAEALKEEQTPKYVSGGTTVEKPTLDVAVPVSVMSQLLAGELGISAAECDKNLKIGADKGNLVLPDHYPALPRQREVVEQIVRAQTSTNIGFHWATDAMPRQVTWKPVVNTLPRHVAFRDWLKDLEALPNGQFGVGLTVDRALYVVDHGGDTPWHLDSCGSGTGKSTRFMVQLAQICHKDPFAEVYCVDTKQVSFAAMHGIPGVHVFDDPVDNMAEIWRVFFVLHELMRDRYTALRTGRKKIEDFNDIWLLVDEGNDLATNLMIHYKNKVKQTGDSAQPTIWSEAIAPLINQGRQVKIRGKFMFQNMTDKALGGISLRDSWGIIGMAGYKRNQWSRIVGTTPVPECKTGPGRIMMVDGPNQTWVQAFYDDPGFLREYAMANRAMRRAS